MNNYQGMRWLKCDLQVQTPEDSAHWADMELRLGEPRRPRVEGGLCEKAIKEKAKVFLRRCHELELDVIGITDHNFSQKTDPRDWFLTHLVEQNKGVAKEFERTPLVIFPGFEVDIGYHVLCLFPPAKKQAHVEECNRALTKLGLAEKDRFNGGGPCLLRKEQQNVSLKTLLSHVQDEMGGIVIAAHSDQASGMLEKPIYREDFKLPELYCVEVTKNPPAQRYLNILEGRDTNWKREGFYPAYIMSSDAKSLKVEESGYPIENSLGYRYTWIKMSNPSIESLRQAFLDPDSRIRLPENIATDKNPDSLFSYPYIQYIKVENAVFLEDQELVFSCNKNCLIGGRGSGKSTVIEYLRLALGKEEGGHDVDYKKVDRIKRTISEPGFKAVVGYCQQHGADYCLELSSDGVRVLESDVVDQETLLEGLPAQFYSQQQLNKITEADEKGRLKSTELLLDLVDGFVSDDLKKLEDEEKKLSYLIHHKQDLESLQLTNKGSISALKQEVLGIEKQWQARKDVQVDAEKHEALKKEQSYIDALKTLVNNSVEQLKYDLAGFDQGFSAFEHKGTPNSAWFYELSRKVEGLNEGFKKRLLDMTEQHIESLRNIFREDPHWPKVKEQIANSDQVFKQACEAKGVRPEDVRQLASLAEQRSKKEQDIARLELENNKLEKEIDDLTYLKKSLSKVWKDQYNLRKEAAFKANNLAVYEGGDKSFVTVELGYQSDKSKFLSVWEEFGPRDKRARIARDWLDLIDEPFEKAIVDLSENIWSAILKIINDDPGLDEVKNYIENNKQEWNRMSTVRIPDSIDITLYRDDGSVAGKVSDNSLSDGQRNTAVLALLLAQDGGPLIIDQPEDELDSNFVFNELIPMIRRMKNRRQLIFATHNANLPVNGDADLLYAFEAKNGRGVCKAQGGLDRQDVTEAVLDIMEGSEKAFTRRREKYGF